MAKVVMTSNFDVESGYESVSDGEIFDVAPTNRRRFVAKTGLVVLALVGILVVVMSLTLSSNKVGGVGVSNKMTDAATDSKYSYKRPTCQSYEYVSGRKCLNCPKGYECNGKRKIPCQAGSYKMTYGKGKCIQCAPGTFGPRAGMKKCKASPCGHYTKTKGAVKAIRCEEGEYQPQDGQARCLKVPKGKENTPRRCKVICSSTRGSPPDLLQRCSNRVCTFDTLTIGPMEVPATANTPSFQGRVYNNMIPGPTLRMKRGHTYHLRLCNEFGPNDPNEQKNSFPHGVNSTNIHLHGLTISPDAPSDSAFDVLIDSRECYNYVFKIRCDHAGGSFWYHPHSKGGVTVSIMRGAAGVAIVEDDAKMEGLPKWFTNMPDRILQIHHLDFGIVPRFQQPDQLGPNFVVGSDNFNLVNGQRPVFDPAKGKIPPQIWWINGQFEPIVEISQSVWTRLRFGYVASTFPLDVAIESNGNCEIQLLARDGVLIHGADNTVPRKIERVHLQVAGRSDVAVRCTALGDFTIRGHTLGFPPPGQAPPGPAVQVKLGILRVGQEKKSSSSSREEEVPKMNTLASFHPRRPVYLRSLLQERNINPHLDVEFTGLGGAAQLQNGKFNSNNPNHIATIALNSVNEWTYHGIRIHHAHVHVMHSQALADAVAFNPANPAKPLVDGSNWLRGDWLETFNHFGDVVTVRFKPDLFSGKIPVHCHILFHGDFGQMGTLTVTNGCDAMCGGNECRRERCNLCRGGSGGSSSQSEFK